jgi:DNA-binding transcriptional LysR family regulator
VLDSHKIKHINRLIYLYHVVSEGGMSKAAHKLSVTPSAVSKQISELENDLQVRVLLRRKKKEGVTLTEAGKRLFTSCVTIMHEMGKIYDHVAVPEDTGKRDLKIITTTGSVSFWILPKISRFIEKYPDLQIKILSTNDHVKFSEVDADVGVLPKVADKPEVSQRRLVTVHSRLFASKDYLKRYGAPRTIEELQHHRLIGFYYNTMGHRGNVDWHLKSGSVPFEPKLTVDYALGQFIMCSLGLGIVAIPKEFPLIKASNLVELEIDHPGVDIDVFFITKSSTVKNEILEDLYRFLVDEI